MEMIEEQGNEEARSNRSRRQSRVENQTNQDNSLNESIDAKFLNSSHFGDLNSSSLMLNVSLLKKKLKLNIFNHHRTLMIIKKSKQKILMKIRTLKKREFMVL